MAANGTEVSTRADEHACANYAVNQPAVTATFYGSNRDPFSCARAASPEQIFIELAAANAITDDVIVADLDLRASDSAQPQAIDRLEDMTVRVIFRVNAQLIEHQGGDPSPAELVARKGGAIKHQNIESGVAQAPGTRRP